MSKTLYSSVPLSALPERLYGKLEEGGGGKEDTLPMSERVTQANITPSEFSHPAEEQDHALMLEGLHEELDRLQKLCSELTLRLATATRAKAETGHDDQESMVIVRELESVGLSSDEVSSSSPIESAGLNSSCSPWERDQVRKGILLCSMRAKLEEKTRRIERLERELEDARASSLPSSSGGETISKSVNGERNAANDAETRKGKVVKDKWPIPPSACKPTIYSAPNNYASGGVESGQDVPLEGRRKELPLSEGIRRKWASKCKRSGSPGGGLISTTCLKTSMNESRAGIDVTILTSSSTVSSVPSLPPIFPGGQPMVAVPVNAHVSRDVPAFPSSVEGENE